ncbi:MAG: VCBS repeat-containing protein [Saprospiraceae bacterium]|nr:VCBS repeat-containing protein [Saprospiraceae bacterium]
MFNSGTPNYVIANKWRFIAILLTFFTFSHAAFSQEESILSGDTLILELKDTSGFKIQWQIRGDSFSSWINISGATINPFAFSVPDSLEGLAQLRAKLVFIQDSCPQFSNVFKYRIVNNIKQLPFGSFLRGGYFYHATKDLALIASTIPTKFMAWGCYGQEINGSDLLGIGDGKQNTLDIIAQCKETNIAAYFCDTLNLNNYSDWYLPSKEELELLLKNIGHLGIVPPNAYNYWSSSEFSKSEAWYFALFDSVSYKHPKSHPYNYVHPIRQFNLKNEKSIRKLFFQLSSTPYDIHVEQSKTAPSNVIVKFIGEQELSDKLVWDFGQGKVLSGSGAGPYEVYYNYEGFNQITAVLNSGNCQKNQFISRYFKVQLFHELKQNFFTNYKGNIKMADYDKDGFKDMLVTGFDSSSLYRYMGNDTFELVNIQLPRLSLSSALWIDFNNDGWNDFILSGYQSKDSTCRSFVYKNNIGNFELMNINIPGIKEGYIESFDLDQDGSHEILLGGEGNGNTIICKIFSVLNEEFIELPHNLPLLKNSSCNIGDYDNDGDADVLLTGHDGTKRNTLLYRNDNGNLFETGMHFTNVDNGCAKFGDYDNDGWPDISITGNRADISVTYPGGILSVDTRPAATLDIFKNLQGINFEKQISYKKWVIYAYSSIDWGDYDNDGDLDILILGALGMQWSVGGTGGGTPSVIYRSAPRIIRNDGQDNFNSIDAYLPADFSDIITIEGYQLAEEDQFKPTWVPKNWQGKNISFTDYNNDGKLDVIREGHYEQANKLYKNCNLYDNLPPSIPELLITKTGCNKVEFSWKESADDHSPVNTLFYEIYVGSNPGASDVASIHNSNYIQNNFYNLNNLQPGTYYWSVKAVDQAQTASAWAPEQSFTISGKPTTPVVSLIGNSLHSSVQSGNQWHDLNGSIAGATAQEYTPISNGTFYSVVTENACSSDTSNQIQFIFSKIITTSENERFKISPNPSKDIFHIHTNFPYELIKYQVINELGKLIQEGQFSKTFNLNLTQFPSGIYFLKLDNTTVAALFKLIKL